MKKCLALIVAVGMVSSFAPSVVSGDSENCTPVNYSNNGFAYINPDLYKDKKETKFEQKKEGSKKEKKKSKTSVGVKLVTNALYYGTLAAGAHEFTNRVGYTSNENVSSNWNNLVNIVKSSSNAKELIKNTTANSGAMNAFGNAYCIVPTCVTIGSIAGSVGSFILGVNNLGWLFGVALGTVISLGATGKSFLNTAIIPGVSKVFDLLPFGGNSK